MEEGGRSVRNRKRNSELICPVCSITIRANEIETHFSIEMQRLKSSCNKNRSANKRPFSLEAVEATSSSSNTRTESAAAWDTYQKIKTNRQARLKVCGFVRLSLLFLNYMSPPSLSSRKTENANPSRISVRSAIG